MKEKKISLVVTILGTAIILIAVIIASIVYFSSQLSKTVKQDEELYYDRLYSISEKLINADRDLYQAMVGAICRHDIWSINEDPIYEELRANYLQDYIDNKAQVLERVNDSIAIASTDKVLYTGTTLEDGSDNFEALSKKFFAEFETWESLRSDYPYRQEIPVPENRSTISIRSMHQRTKLKRLPILRCPEYT